MKLSHRYHTRINVDSISFVFSLLSVTRLFLLLGKLILSGGIGLALGQDLRQSLIRVESEGRGAEPRFSLQRFKLGDRGRLHAEP